MPFTFRGGRLPADPSAPKVDLTPHLKADGYTVPSSVDYYSHVAAWQMLGNDEWGDCVFAGDGHVVIQQTAYGLGKAQDVTTSQVLAAYSAVTGFNPNAGPPGDNPTDNGSTVANGLEYLRTKGIGGFKIAAYGSIDVSDHQAVKRGIEDFGALSLGIEVPDSMIQQFQEGKPFTVVPGAQIEGGHCIIAVGYDQEYVYVATWGTVAKMTWAFWDAYVGEAHAVISSDWTTVTGLSLEAFGEEFAEIFGGGNPFVPSPSFWGRVVHWFRNL